MNGWKASWRIALRHGRRDIAKARGRSALVVLMIGTPVLLTSLLIVLVASGDLSQAERLDSQIGRAQASLARVDGVKVVQEPDGVGFTSSGRSLPEDVARARAEKILGTRLGPKVVEDYGTLRIGERGLSTELRGIDTTSELTRGMYAVEQGRAPRSPQEILVNPVLADDGATIGTRVVLDDRPFTVVGIGRPSAAEHGGRDGAAVVLPQDLDVESSTTLVGGRAVTWPVVRKLNALGYVVTSRHVYENGVTDAQQREVDQALGDQGSGDSADRAVLVIAASSVMIEVVLLACPAFAVGVRRQRRELALLAASGASPRQLRRLVLGQAAVLGVVASVVAAWPRTRRR
ncbi:MAG: ABC transporter permease, partial [Actinomycetales bacterium]